jgi:ATP-dependent exoDNAse (exonuclease V) beta subunit
VVPVCGDAPIDGWLNVLSPVVYPDARDWRSPRPAPGCPPFTGIDTVLERPPKVQHGSDDAVAPGLHASREGGHAVVWWDPSALELGKEHDSGLRQQKLLEADAQGTATEEGIKSHDAWRARRAELLARGATPTLHVRTAADTAAAPREADPDAASVAPLEHAEVAGRRVDRPHHKRFGTLVHAVLAEAPLDADAAAVARVAAVQARLIGAPDEEATAAAEAVCAALAHPLLARAAASDRRGECRREAGVSLALADGEIVEGVVDLAFREDGAWTVVDYKTDIDVARAGMERYDAQVRLYARAIARATGERARAVLLRV